MPTNAHGKVCYIQIPATDIARSSQFYAKVFGWNLRTRGDGVTAFDDSTGQVSGEWVTGRPPMTEPGPLIFIMVQSAAAAQKSITDAGGRIVKPVGHHPREKIALLADPGGNVMGIYEEP
jgi:predicted enzyme related to lactoylglutathione lyase